MPGSISSPSIGDYLSPIQGKIHSIAPENPPLRVPSASHQAELLEAEEVLAIIRNAFLEKAFGLILRLADSANAAIGATGFWGAAPEKTGQGPTPGRDVTSLNIQVEDVTKNSEQTAG